MIFDIIGPFVLGVDGLFFAARYWAIPKLRDAKHGGLLPALAELISIAVYEAKNISLPTIDRSDHGFQMHPARVGQYYPSFKVGSERRQWRRKQNVRPC
jgi:hypothetical protein